MLEILKTRLPNRSGPWQFLTFEIENYTMVKGMQEVLPLVENLKKGRDYRERLKILNQQQRVKSWLQKSSWLNSSLADLGEEAELIIKSLIAIGQEHVLPFKLDEDFKPESAERLKKLLEELSPVEAFYKEIGGVVGYHATIVSFLNPKEISQEAFCAKEKLCYHRPPGTDLTIENETMSHYISQGIDCLPYMAEVYPVGGAADRLNFCDPKTGLPLPAAKLSFVGHTLLEGLIRDVQAREYLYYKRFGKQITIPVVMMTSAEKDNHRHILALCEEKEWFGRPKETFRFLSQPLVPTMDRMGNWCCKKNSELLMKPGGHGVIWKVARDEGVFDWLEGLGKKKLLVRQINNPIAGVDYGILAFCGVGFAENKLFGFASCPRQVQSAEGVNILIEKKSLTHSNYCLTNIEYCDFSKFGIEDVSVSTDSPYSQFPSNTNILFADIAAIKKAVTHCPVPGMIVNLKKMSFTDDTGSLVEREIARLESTMQNIADYFVYSAASGASLDAIALDTYLTYNQRNKTISTTKKMYYPGASLLETPEGCFYDHLMNAYDLLTHHCHVTLPQLSTMDSYVKNGPPFLFFYHPALGPLYKLIAQKIRGGVFAEKSELKLEIAELEIVNLRLNGSLHVIADRVIGEKDSQGILRYSTQVGRCRLINVSVENQGYDSSTPSCYWNTEVHRRELCEIILHGNGEFFAENVVFSGNQKIEVQNGSRLIAYVDQHELKFKTEAL